MEGSNGEADVLITLILSSRCLDRFRESARLKSATQRTNSWRFWPTPREVQDSLRCATTRLLGTWGLKFWALQPDRQGPNCRDWNRL